jgi:hypothetical protein
MGCGASSLKSHHRYLLDKNGQLLKKAQYSAGVKQSTLHTDIPAPGDPAFEAGQLLGVLKVTILSAKLNQRRHYSATISLGLQVRPS